MKVNSDSLLINDKFEAPLSKTIQKEYNKLVDAISKINVQNYTIKEINGTGGLVSITDLIAYQIGWGKLLIEWYKTGLEGKIVHMPGQGFKTWDYKGLALHFYKKYQYDSTHEQKQVFHDVVMQILSIVEKEHKTGNLYKTGIWAWCTLKSGKQWPLSKWITINTSSPYKKAYGLVKAFSKK